MKTTFAFVAMLTLSIAGCGREISTVHRSEQLSDFVGKTVSEAYQYDNDTAVLRFEDGTMLQIESGNGTLFVNNEVE